MPTLLEAVQAALAPRYEVDREIGRGGMATVYRARDAHVGRAVAIKVLRPELSYSRLADRFRLEIAIAAKLNHRHIVAVHDWGEAAGMLYYVMPLIDGETLRAALLRDGACSLDRAVAVIRDVAEGLEYAHRAGVVHRDVKPENILITSGYAMVADFGVARILEQATEDRMSSAGAVFGTIQYMSPEQAGGESRLNARSDIYSLACVCYEMLTLDTSFPRWSAERALVQRVLGQPLALARIRPDLPPDVADVLHRALAVDPSDRFGSVLEFAAQLGATAAGGRATRAPGLRGWLGWVAGRRRRALALGGLVVGALAAPVLGSLLVADPPAFTGRPSSVVAVPFRDPMADGRDVTLADDLAAALTMELNQWESIRAVPRVALAGPAFDLGLAGPAVARADEGIALARRLGVQALVVIATSRAGDSVSVEATMYDAATGRGVGRPWQSRALATDLAALVGPIAKGLLELDGSRVDLSALRERTAFPEALGQESKGRAALERWRLDEAERHFRQALAIDSTFAGAAQFLGLTLYWRSALAPEELSEVGPEIARLSGAAMRHADRLPARDRAHIRAFHAFQAGDYARARSEYAALLARDPTDVYAWLMAGSVEYRDPWLAPTPGDSVLRPRADLNLAVRAFAETTRLQPRFDLGYGHLFDIYERVAGPTERRGCWGFEEPRDEQLAPWDVSAPHRQRAFCPVAGEAISWRTEAEFARIDSTAVRAGEARLLETRIRLLRRWAAYAPEEAKPRRELGVALLTMRARLGLAAPELSDSLGGEALRLHIEALALDPDTTRNELWHLASLHLAAGDPGGAVEWAERALRRPAPDPPSPPPVQAANVFLALGQPTRALAALASDGRQRFVQDDSTGRLVAFGGAEFVIDRIRVLGASGVIGPDLLRELREVDRLWSSPRYSRRDRQVLYRAGALRVAPALVADSAALAAWDRGAGSPRGGLWEMLVNPPTDAATVAGWLSAAVPGDAAGLSDVSRTYLLGALAIRGGHPALAARLLARVDSIALDLDVLEIGWALRPVSSLLRGRALEAVGDRRGALVAFQRVVDSWGNPDSLTGPLVAEARAAVQRLRSAER
ncbi:MAG: protein kinase [Gemmatimonadales bacterium]|nr:protein kinase [Gemmatimonadales bacterium]